MNQLYKKVLVPILVLAGTTTLLAQTLISGTVKDGGTQAPLAGVNIVAQGTKQGTVTDSNGKYALNVNQSPPFTIVFSFTGFHTEKVVVTENNTTNDLIMEEESILGQEVVVSASRMEESIMKSPVTIEKMDLISIKQAATPDYFDALANMKGVQVTSSSLTNTSVNTRGFADVGNTRFVQLIDGVDSADPTIGHAVGSVMAPGELDVESLELIPGAASALYGPNAFNGIMLLKSKSPFDYQGLSAMVKMGITNSKAGGAHPLGTYGIRYAKAFKDKLAFKVNFHYMGATDWTANDIKTDRNNPSSKTDLTGMPDFDGVNLQGDESALVTIPGIGTLHRTGFSENILLNNQEARILKGDAAIHYKLNEKMELIGAVRLAQASALYQADVKYAFRRYQEQSYKLELKSDQFFVRSYVTNTVSRKSYHLGALGAYVNESFNPSYRPADGSGWINDYATAFLGGAPGFAADDQVAARSYADRFMIDPTTGNYVASLQDTINKVRSNLFQRNPPGAKFFTRATNWHTELFYNFKQIKWAEVIAGGNFRYTSVFSDGTLFDDAPDDPNNAQPILTNTYGVYTQIAKSISEKLKVTGSIRYDKMKDFDGHFTPRVSMVYSPNKNHNFRASFQTGFRFPELTFQFIYFDNPDAILLGGAPSIASRYGVHNGGAWTSESYNNFSSQGGTLDPTTGAITSNPGNVTLETANIGYVKPEQQQTFEVGYKGLLAGELFIDLNYYYSSYTDFTGTQVVVGKVSTTHQGTQVDAGRLWSLGRNSPNTLHSSGVGLGLTYNLPKDFVLNANYNYTTFSGTLEDGFLTQFNTPTNRFGIGIANRKLAKNFGFTMNYRYQQSFFWQSLFGETTIPAYGVLDAQVNYKFSSLKTILKIGGTNLGGKDYRTSFGSPFVGQQYYVSLVFDDLLK